MADPIPVTKSLIVVEEKKTFSMVSQLYSFFQKYVYFENSLFYFFSSIYVILTHVYEIFDELPYLLIHGLKGSGKTRLGDMFEGLCWNPIDASDITPAFLYRIIGQKSLGVTIIIDEADDLSYQRKSGPLPRILRSGYQRNGKIGRCDPNRKGILIPTFCPKIIINQGGVVDPALESRTIPILMIKTESPLEKFRFARAQGEFKEIRKLIDSFLDQQGNDIAERYASFAGVEGIANREEELWTPIFVIADVLDTLLPQPLIKEGMVKLAREIVLQRRRKQLLGSREDQILESTRAFIEQNEPVNSDGFYVGEDLCQYIRDRWGITNLKLETVSRTLNQHDLIKSVRRPRLEMRGKSRALKEQRTCYLIDKDKLYKITNQYFDESEVL